jgi:hypothetical protein
VRNYIPNTTTPGLELLKPSTGDGDGDKRSQSQYLTVSEGGASLNGHLYGDGNR